MELPSMDASRGPEQLLSDILTYIEQSEQLLKAGNTVRLAGLDTVVDALCQRVVALSPDDAREYAPELEHLNTRLSALAEAMGQAKTALNASISELEKRHRASRAYLNAPDSNT